MNIESFLKDWEANTTELEGPLTQSRRLYKDVLEVQLTKSGRDNTVRINANKSLEKKKGHASKFLKWLVKEADKGKFELSACVQPWGHSFEKTPSADVLKNSFAKLGFSVRFEYPDEGFEMVRQPKGSKKK